MEHLLILHGALGSKQQFKQLDELLSLNYITHRINLKGHGGTDFPKNFSIENFSEEVVTYLSNNNIEKVNIFGYSMGGYIGMYLAKKYPGKINKLITLATKFHWDKEIAAKEKSMLDAKETEEKVPAFAKILQERHYPQDWKALLEKTSNMLVQMGNQNPLQPDDYNTIQTPVLLMLGDRDKMVTLDETLAVYKKLPSAQMSILPATIHPVEKVKVERLVFEITSFIGKKVSINLPQNNSSTHSNPQYV